MKSSAILLVFLFAACAQVPKQSVELSATVGRDITEMYRAHRELAGILFDRMKKDVNEFVDDVYAPYQISKLLEEDYEDFQSGDGASLFAALDAAIKQPDNSIVQREAVDFMDAFVELVREEVESYRTERLKPVIEQEQEVLSSIDRSYFQIHYANSIVTGHLSSIVKVHDAQESILNEFGLQGVRKEIGEKLASTSNEIARFVEEAKKVKWKTEEMHEKIKKLTEELDKVIGRFREESDEE
ncbi:MAG: hypothetical protein GTO29_13280 [Candidatus Latescibacteria bacterium]|nr:hypothetical protein [Candidatus Latescibacterota bacterium]NIO57223.1 hypothetical protein [Candidatus Latescibacterota bacterium]